MALAALYAFVLPALGLQDQGAPNMYSNLQMHGRGNHLVAPTDVVGSLPLLAPLFETARVEASSSEHINGVCSGDATPPERACSFWGSG